MQIRRREFLATTGVAAAGAVLGAPDVGWAAQTDAIDAVFDRAVVFDALSVDPTWTDEVFAAAKRSGLTVIHTTLATSSLAAATADLTKWQALFDRHPDQLVKALRRRDFTEAKKQGRLAVVLGFQDATMIGASIRNLDVLYTMGTRCIQLTYNSRNLLGDGGTERTNAGLSDFGVAVVERMNELGIVVDLSHCGDQTTSDGIAFSKKPAAFTHTVCKAVHNHVRGKSDAQLKALADKGGVVGIATLGYFVGPTPDTSFDDYLKHVDHAVKVAGVDHVGLASDYSIRGIEATATRENWYVPRLTSFKPIYNVRWPPWIKELDPPERYRNIARGLAKRNYPTGTIEKILGGNWARFFGDALGDS